MGAANPRSPSSGRDGERPHHVVVLVVEDVAVVDRSALHLRRSRHHATIGAGQPEV
jgi:hypothetical protein